MKRSHTKTLLASAIATITATTGGLATAQSTSEDEQALYEEVVVTGFRQSITRAKDLKQEAVGARDSIVAEDIADFPDMNLAESLQRVPGIAITREGGEGRQISLRGLGADFTQVQLNGMEALGTSSSPMDSRGNVNRSRAFDFNLFASELFNRVDVRKSFSADMDEGGIGGTVDLMTAKPFDYDGFQGAVSGQLGQNSITEDISPRVATLLSNTWGDFGALASVAYSKRNVSEQGYNTYRWRAMNGNGSDLSELPQEQQDLITNSELHFSRGSRYSLFENEQERLGTTVALQYMPTDNFELGLDLLYGQLNNERGEYHLQSRGASSTALGCAGPAYDGAPRCSKLVELEYNAGNEAVYSRFEDAAIHSESRDQYADTTFSQVVLNGRWDATERLSIEGLLGRQGNTFETGSAKVYLESFADQEIDYREDKFYATNRYSYDPTQASHFRYHEIDLSEDEVDTAFDLAKFDLNYDLNATDRLQAGLSAKSFEYESGGVTDNNVLETEWSEGTVDDTLDTSLTYTNRGHKRQDWMSIDVDGVLNEFGVDRNLTMTPFKDKVEEETLAAYLQYEFETELGSRRLRGNLGARYYQTEITSTGTVNEDIVELTQDYDGILPALNLALDLSDKLVLRASASQNVTRPSLASLNATGRVDNDPLGPRGLSVNSGNPGLEPFESNNLEGSIEYYFDDVGYAALSVFHKSVDNFIVVETETMPYRETGYPLNLLGENDGDGNPQSGDTAYTVIQPRNLDDSTIRGLELSFQRDMDFLPAPFNDLGLIANYTYSDGESLYRNVGNSGVDAYKSFPGLSKNSGNVTVYYERDSWGARISSAYRSDYISAVEAGNGDEDERGFHATTYVDFSAFYQVSDALKFTIEGINLTDEREEQYSDSSDRLYNTTESGRTLYLGATYQF